MTTAETTQAVRNALKSNGYNNRKVSVTNDGAIWVTVKDLDINIDDIEKLVKKYEHYYTDEITGEILQGGNTFIFVQYDYRLSA